MSASFSSSLKVGLVLGAFFVAMPAIAFERNNTITGPGGKSGSVSRSGNCVNGVCSGSSSVSGPRGNSGSKECSAGNGTTGCTVTGPKGRSGGTSGTYSR